MYVKQHKILNRSRTRSEFMHKVLITTIGQEVQVQEQYSRTDRVNQLRKDYRENNSLSGSEVFKSTPTHSIAVTASQYGHANTGLYEVLDIHIISLELDALYCNLQSEAA